MTRSPSSSYRLSYDISASIRLQVTKGVDELFTRPWFFRTWVIQEAALAKQAVVICGNDFVPWNSLSIINLNLTSHPFKLCRWGAAGDIRRSPDPPKTFLNHVPPTIRLQLGHTDQSRNLWNLVRDVRACRANDPRDKIFAVLGLVNDMNARPFIPDYSKTVGETYLDFAIYLISESKASLADILRESQSQTHIAEVPSWVPDWSAEPMSFAVARDFMAPLSHAQPGPETEISTLVPRGGTLDFLGKEIDIVHCMDVEYAPGKPIIRKIVDIMPTYQSSFKSLLSMLESIPGHTLFLGENCIFVGAGPLAMMEGDAVCLLAGLELPWVLRPHRDGYRLVGECAFFEPGEHCKKCEPPEPREWKRIIIY
ncbi:hypothetical protein SLS55_005498 [Diplodia seriata]|uniref:Heterokaryon incompatibility domain-containing protein n=1 Tax=Diplodia seriata TaxID=420778 RepID=A0ABR3CGJ7_9PEZI